MDETSSEFKLELLLDEIAIFVNGRGREKERNKCLNEKRCLIATQSAAVYSLYTTDLQY